MSKSEHSKTPAAKSAAHDFHVAFDKTAAARAALSVEDLVAINLDVQVALTTVMGTLPRIAAFRDEMVQLPAFDITNVDKLTTYAEALAHAQAAYLAASSPVEPLPALVARATEIRELLLSDASALAKRGMLDGKRLAELKGGPGYLNICSDVGVLVRMLRERWSEIASKTALQPSELDEAEELFQRVTRAYAGRAQQSPIAVAAADDRHRAYTLLMKAYDESRRAVTFLRWHEGDFDKIAPSLFAGRRRSASSPDTEPPVDGATDNGHVAADAPAAHAAPSPGTPAPPAVGNGFPGASPFNSN